MKLKKLLTELNIPIKVGDTILVGKWRNKAVKIEKIGKDEQGLPTVNGRSIVKFRLPKKVKKEGVEKREFDLQINKYPIPPHKKTELISSYNSDAGVWGYSTKYDRVVIFKRTGALTGPNNIPGGKQLPQYWEKYVVGRF
jgi:hypothetical protein